MVKDIMNTMYKNNIANAITPRIMEMTYTELNTYCAHFEISKAVPLNTWIIVR